MKFIIVNGEIINKEEANFTSFYLNDPLILVEKVWFGFGGIPLFTEKLKQLIQQLRDLGANIPELFLSEREFFRRIKRMLNKNRFYRTGLINFQILISKTQTNFVLLASPFEQMDFIYHDKGVLISISDIQKYSKSPFQFSNNTKVIGHLTLAKNEEPQIQKFIFLNENGVVCDAGSANVFFIKKNVLITPSLETGYISDNLRKLVLEASITTGLQITESADIIPELIYKMDEIFFASEVEGIQWVLGIKTKRFVHSVSNKIHKELNEILKSKVD